MISDILVKGLNDEFDSIPPIEELEKMYSFSERHIRLMEAIFAELRRRERMEGYWNAVRKIAVIIITILAIAFVSVKFVPEVYAYVKEWLMEFAEDKSIEFRGRRADGEAGDNENLRFELGYVPEGYELESEVRRRNSAIVVIYRNSLGNILQFEYRDKEAGDLLAVDIEQMLTEEVFFDGILYNVFECEGRRSVVVWEREGYLLKIEGVIECDKLLDVAISLIFLEN